MSGCGCVYVGEYESADFFRRSKQLARKEHKCNECHRIIKPGEEYEYVSGYWDGDFSVYKTCSDCLSIRNEFFCEGYFYEMVWEYLGEHINEVSGEIPESCLAALTPIAREKVCELIETAWWEDKQCPEKNG